MIMSEPPPQQQQQQHIPFDIQEQIMKRLPAKKLIQFKTVSKPWKSLVESSEFMADYNLSQTGPHHLFIRHDGIGHYRGQKHVSLLDNDTFPQHRFVHTLPESLSGYQDLPPRVVGSSHGLFCLFGGSYVDFLVVIWNPSINKSIALEVSVSVHRCRSTRIGFGVRPDTCDPMLVIINDFVCLPFRFHVFRLSTGVWTIGHSNLPLESIGFTINQVDVNGFIYWNAHDRVAGLRLIVSFDMKSEKFSQVSVPKCLASKSFSLSKLRESLAVLEYYKEAQMRVCAVWMMMEDGVQKSFTKLYTVSLQDALWEKVLGFRKCGKPIVGTLDDDEEHVLLSVYEPHSKNSKNIDGLGIYREFILGSLFVSSYTETLLLLDHPDNHGKPIPFRVKGEPFIEL